MWQILCHRWPIVARSICWWTVRRAPAALTAYHEMKHWLAYQRRKYEMDTIIGAFHFTFDYGTIWSFDWRFQHELKIFFSFSLSFYRDVSCNEVMGSFKYILIASTILNFIGFLLCFTLLILLCMRQKPVKRVPYSSANSRHRLWSNRRIYLIDIFKLILCVYIIYD